MRTDTIVFTLFVLCLFGAAACENVYRDADGDGYGDPAKPILAGKQRVGYVSDNTDCDDTDPDVHPRRACRYDIGRFDSVASVGVIYPCCMDDGFAYGATTLTGIASGNRPHEQLHWLVLELVKQNIIVFAASPVDNMTVAGYQSAHIDTIQKIKEENMRDGSPLAGRIGAIGVAGVTAGGEAVLNVSQSHAEDIDVAVAISPSGLFYDLSKINHPTLIIAGTNDRITPPILYSAPAFEALEDTIPAAFATLPDYSSVNWTAGGGKYGDSAKQLIAAWFRWAFYEDQDAYEIVQDPPDPIQYNQKQNL